MVLPVLRSVVEAAQKVVEEVDAQISTEFIHTLTFLGHHLACVLIDSAAAANVVSIQHFQSTFKIICFFPFLEDFSLMLRHSFTWNTVAHGVIVPF